MVAFQLWDMLVSSSTKIDPLNSLTFGFTIVIQAPFKKAVDMHFSQSQTNCNVKLLSPLTLQ
jgi:hypothetical protein